MNSRRTAAPAALGLALLAGAAQAQPATQATAHAQVRSVVRTAAPAAHVLLISVDGLHASDLAAYIQNNPQSNLAKLAASGVVYPNATTTRPSDSFPGTMALLTGGDPVTEGVWYDVGYDRTLLPPTNQGFVSGSDPTSSGGIDYVGESNPNFAQSITVPGTETDMEEFVEFDFRRLDGGASLHGGIALDTTRLPRDPNTGNPVTPNNFGRNNTVFGVAHAAGLYTAFSDKHAAAYTIAAGPDATATAANPAPSINDFYSPEVAAYIAIVNGQLVDPSDAPAAVANDPNFQGGNSSGTSSIVNVEAYDNLKVQAIINEIDGKDHTGTVTVNSGQAPAIFGMNFQSVSVGEKLTKEPSPVNGADADPNVGLTGGYTGANGTAGPLLTNAFNYVDASLGRMAAALAATGQLGDTTIIVTAKHGQSPINIGTLRMLAKGTTAPGLSPVTEAPAEDLGYGNGNPQPVTHAIEDDISLIWLGPGADLNSQVAVLNADRTKDAIQSIISGPLLRLDYDNPATDPRTPDIIVQPDPGVIYSGSKKKVAEHGGFSHDDTSIALLVSGAGVTAPGSVDTAQVHTTQVAPTILKVLGLNPQSLTAVQAQGTTTLPGF